MFKPICFCAAISLAFTSKSVLAQDKQSQPPPTTATSKVQQAAVAKPQNPLHLSKGQIALGDGLIVPGKRIGPVELGMPLEQVEKLFGPPVNTTKMDGDFSYSIWRWETPNAGKPRHIFFLVIYQKGSVVQIQTDHLAFALPNGLSAQSSEEQWTAFWGEKPERYGSMMSIADSPLNVNWKKSGFALRVSSPEWHLKSGLAFRLYPLQSQSVIVFPAGRLAMSTFGLWSFVSFGPNAKPSTVVSPTSSKTGAESAPAPK